MRGVHLSVEEHMSQTTKTGLVLDRIGATYAGEPWPVTAAGLAAYAAATNDPNPRYREDAPGGPAMPPVYPVRVIRDLFFETLLDQANGVDMARLVHGSQAFVYHRPLKAGDQADPSAEIIGMEGKSSGDLYTVRYRVHVGGELAVEATSGFFIRAPRDPNAPKPPKGPTPAPSGVEGPPPDVEDTIEVTPDQMRRYADASGDENPIHLDDDFAKMVGLGGVILQGLCTRAFGSRALVTGLLGGDPAALRTLSVRFASMVRPGDRVTTRVWREGGAFRFDSVNQAGVRVLDQGQAGA